MPSEKILKNKQQTVTEIADDMKNATTVVFVDARGLQLKRILNFVLLYVRMTLSTK